MASICPSTAMSHVLFSYLLLFFLCYYISSCSKPVYGAEDARDGFHSTPVSALLPKNKCSVPDGERSRGGLRITPKYGPCSRSGHTQPPSSHEILGRDEHRAGFINSRFNQYTPQNWMDHGRTQTKFFGEDGNFLVDVGFGTPPQQFKLILDTGSSITWIQCKSCVSCLKGPARFDPSASSTYSNGSCISNVGQQGYKIRYEDNSSSYVNFGCDTLSLEPSDVFHKFQFGCGIYNQGNFGREVDGLMGLGRGELSTVSQTAPKFNKVFSYCLPEEDSIGSLFFGEKATSLSSSLKFTKLLSHPDSEFYFVNLLGISVGNRRLNIPSSVFAKSGTIIDSGTVITRLPQPVYSKLKAAFKKAMKKYPRSNRRPEKGDILDTCYDLGGTEEVLLPDIVLHFGEGTDVRLTRTGIIWGNDKSHLCLSFAGNSFGGDSNLTIIGNRQQVSMTVLYDIQGGRIGFGGNGCS